MNLQNSLKWKFWTIQCSNILNKMNTNQVSSYLSNYLMVIVIKSIFEHQFPAIKNIHHTKCWQGKLPSYKWFHILMETQKSSHNAGSTETMRFFSRKFTGRTACQREPGQSRVWGCCRGGTPACAHTDKARGRGWCLANYSKDVSSYRTDTGSGQGSSCWSRGLPRNGSGSLCPGARAGSPGRSRTWMNNQNVNKQTSSSNQD